MNNECKDLTGKVRLAFRKKVITSHVAIVIKNLPANAGDVRDMGSIPRSGRSPGGGYGNPLQYSCLENPHGQRSLVGYSHRVSKSQTWLK